MKLIHNQVTKGTKRTGLKILPLFLCALGFFVVLLSIRATPTFVVKKLGSGAGGGDLCIISTNSILYYYRLDEASTPWVDAAGQMVNLTPGFTSPASYAGKITNAIGIDATKTNFLITTATTVGDMTNGDHTLTFWAYSSNVTSGLTVISKGWDPGMGMKQQYFCGINSQGGTNLWNFQLAGTNGMGFPTAVDVYGWNSGAVQSNTWYFVCAQFCRASNYVAISINNGAFDTNTFSASLQPKTFSSKLYVGAGEQNAPPGFGGRWPGLIDEIGLWARNLTPSEVTCLYNAGAPGAHQTYPFN